MLPCGGMHSILASLAFLHGCVPRASADGQLPRVGAERMLGSHIVDLQWLGKEKNVVILQTNQGFLHRSSDGGETWSDISALLNTSKAPGSSAVIPSRIRRMYRSPVNTSIIFGMGMRDDNFISSDDGVSWTRVNLPHKLYGFNFHASRATWALVSYWTDSCLLQKDEPCSHSLFLTKDLGASFTLVGTHIVQFSWGKENFHQEDRVYFTHFVNKKESQQRLTRWMAGIDFAYTDDYGATVKRVIPEGNKFQMSYEYILVVKVTNTAKQNVSLMVSADGATSFGAAQLPHKLWQHSFALLDASEGALVLHVNQGKDVGDIYISDKAGQKFTLSLTRNVRQLGFCAFEKVMNLNGIYISNVYESYNLKQQSGKWKEEPSESNEGAATGSQLDFAHPLRYRRLEDEDLLSSPGGEGVALASQAERRAAERLRRGDRERKGRRLAQGPGGTAVRTVISFDAGGLWSYLQPPKVDSLGKEVDCVPPACSLHLHDFTEVPVFSPVYSYRNAVGIIMGSGNLGAALSARREDTNTYLSRDGGRSWMEVHKGTFIYEFGNHGGLLVMADMVRETTEALYSWNEGTSWQSFKIAEKPMKVDNVIIEPDATATKFLLYGERARSGISKILDFASVHQRTCKGAGSAGAMDSDYEKWTVPCILGQQRIYSRRKQQSQCFNNETTEKFQTLQKCACTEMSFECELGFTRSIGSTACVLENPRVLPRAATAGCPGAGKFAVDAYRKVPGDVCEGGWTPQKVSLDCPRVDVAAAVDAPMRQGSWLPFKSFLVVCTVGLGMCLSRSERFQAWLKALKERAHPTVPPGPAACGGTQIGHSRATSSHEMVGLTGPDQQGYHPPEI